MTSGKAYLFHDNDFAVSDGSGVTSVTLSDDGDYFTVQQGSGHSYEVPWDAVLYHAEPAYEYHKSKTAQVGQERGKRIGQKVRQARMQRGMSSTELAKLAGLQRPNLSRIESGKHVPALETLEKIAGALDMPVAELLATG